MTQVMLFIYGVDVAEKHEFDQNISRMTRYHHIKFCNGCNLLSSVSRRKRYLDEILEIKKFHHLKGKQIKHNRLNEKFYSVPYDNS